MTSWADCAAWETPVFGSTFVRSEAACWALPASTWASASRYAWSVFGPESTTAAFRLLRNWIAFSPRSPPARMSSSSSLANLSSKTMFLSPVTLRRTFVPMPLSLSAWTRRSFCSAYRLPSSSWIMCSGVSPAKRFSPTRSKKLECTVLTVSRSFSVVAFESFALKSSAWAFTSFCVFA
jgi:hypothetical protein